MLNRNNAYFEAMLNRVPVNMGECKAYRAWDDSVEKGYDELVMSDGLFADEVQGFLNTLSAAGVDSFVYTAKSTATMDNMYAFVMFGCTMEGMCEVVRERYGRNRSLESVPGVRFRIN